MKWTEDDLIAASAAIRLGDTVLPPLGTVVEWLPHAQPGPDTRTRIGTVVWCQATDTFDIPCGWVLHVEERSAGTWHVDPERILRVVKVPTWCDPFSLWTRAISVEKFVDLATRRDDASDEHSP